MKWCVAAQVVDGADDADHAGSYLENAGVHWEHAIKRLALGTFLNGPDRGRLTMFETEAERLSPIDSSLEQRADLAELIHLIRDLISDVKMMRSARLTISDWSVYLVRVFSKYIVARSESDDWLMSQVLRVTERLCSKDVEGYRVSYEVASELLEREFALVGRRRAGFNADGVAVSALLPMRTLPFRVVFVAGLNEGQFPGFDPPNPLDLRQAKGQAGE